MSFDDVVLNRRSIRKYLDKDVSMSDVEKIIKTGILAPSAHNRQPWKVKVVVSEEKTKIYEALLAKKDEDSSVANTAGIINEVPCLLVVFYDGNENRDHDMLSLGAFIENMHLKATELGLGSLWIANTDRIKKEISEITDVGLECISCLAIGYKDQEPSLRPRKNLEEIIIK